jgi:hypothetical protein
MRKEIVFQHLRKIVMNANKEQIDAYSRFMHSLSLAALLSLTGLSFTEEEVLIVSIKFLGILILALMMFSLGIQILKDSNGVEKN